MSYMNPLESSKKARTAAWFNDHASFGLRCIHCQAPLHFTDFCLKCTNHHSFDMAKQGYFFLAIKSVDDKYDQYLFEARRAIIQSSSLYHVLHKKLEEILATFTEPLTILDAGCGEGSHLERLCRSFDGKHTAIAIDLSKVGVQRASDYVGQLLPLVADLSRLPIANQQVDMVLSILSPANYQEFKRILKPGGTVIKVVPNPYYLDEIRQALKQLGHSTKETYSNSQIRQVFQENMTSYSEIPLQYTVILSESERQSLITMTPLTWQLKSEEKAKLFMLLPEKITVDLTILVGKV